jgi:hypothetical protein
MVNTKNWSRLYKGILKQIKRQSNKPHISKVVLKPEILSFSEKHGEYRPLKRKFYNNRNRGGKGLDALASDPYFTFSRPVNGMYTRCLVSKETGKYRLSKTGKELLLNKKRKKGLVV